MIKPSFQQLSSLQEKTCVVIGGGIVGASQAYFLSRNHKNKVILIDSLPGCGQATTKANSCMVMLHNTFPYTYKPLTDFFPQGLFKNEVIQKISATAILEPGTLKFGYYWLLKAKQPYLYSDQALYLNKLNHQLIQEFLQENAIKPQSIDYDQDCFYANLYQIEEKEVENYKEKLRMNSRLDRFLNEKEIQEVVCAAHPKAQNLDLFNLCLYEPITKVNSLKLTQAFESQLKKQSNVQLLLSTKVTKLNMDVHNRLTSLHVHNQSDPIKADACVLCLGSYTPSFVSEHLNLSLPLVPIKGYSFEFNLGKDGSKKKKAKAKKIHLKMSQYGIVFTYLQDNIVRVSGMGDIAGLDHTIDLNRINYMKKLAGRIYGEEFIMKNSYNEWCGMRPCMPDDKPVIGSLNKFENVMINTGHGGRGLTQGVATSKILSEMIDEGQIKDAEHYLEPFDVARFKL